MIDLPDPSASHDGRWPLAAVLVVDDEPGMRNFLEKTLRSRVGHVQGAATAEQADEQVRRHRFDLVILDINLPGKSGITWLRELREQGYAGEVVLITAFADLDTAIERCAPVPAISSSSRFAWHRSSMQSGRAWSARPSSARTGC